MLGTDNYGDDSRQLFVRRVNKSAAAARGRTKATYKVTRRGRWPICAMRYEYRRQICLKIPPGGLRCPRVDIGQGKQVAYVAPGGEIEGTFTRANACSGRTRGPCGLAKQARPAPAFLSPCCVFLFAGRPFGKNGGGRVHHTQTAFTTPPTKQAAASQL
jgi:hypothetical protein